MSQEIHVGDVGTIFEVTVTDSGVAVDISAATTKQIIFAKPDGTIVVKDAVFVGTGTDGKLKYTTIANDLDLKGDWRLQVKVVLPSGTWKSDIQEFKVYLNLE